MAHHDDSECSCSWEHVRRKETRIVSDFAAAHIHVPLMVIRGQLNMLTATRDQGCINQNPLGV